MGIDNLWRKQILISVRVQRAPCWCHWERWTRQNDTLLVQKNLRFVHTLNTLSASDLPILPICNREAVTGIKGMANLFVRGLFAKNNHYLSPFHQQVSELNVDLIWFHCNWNNTTHSAQLRHKCKLCIKPQVLPFFSMSLINNLKFVDSFCARGLKHFQVLPESRCGSAGCEQRQDEDTPLRAIIHPNYRHRICTTEIAALWGMRGWQRARNVSDKLGHLLQGWWCSTWEVGDKPGLTLRGTAADSICFSLGMQRLGSAGQSLCCLNCGQQKWEM